MDPWQEVTEGDMQRQAENAYMFRRSYTKDFAYLCTPHGYTGPLAPDLAMECYARDISRVDWFNPSVTPAEFEALTVEDVGAPSAATSAPVNVDLPHVSQTDDVLNCTMGNWDGEPTSYAYQWKIDGGNVGTNAADYTSTAGDVGHTCTCDVTATNAAGSATATSVEVTVA